MRPGSIGPYHIIRELGRGAMGIVYLGYDSDIERPVAIKTIQVGSDEPEAEVFRQALSRDARAAGRLSHPGIVTIFHMGREQSAVFVAMEYVEGPTLATWARMAPRSPAEIMAMLRKVAEALDYAHSVPIVHRDIKPANILVAGNGQPKITDFGLAKLTTSAGSLSGQVLGTPRYISPEQIRGGIIDGRCDQFSLGVMAYELLTGRVPFPGDTYEALLYQVLTVNPVPAHEVNPRLPAAVSQVIGQALAKEPQYRFWSCLQFISALETAFAKQPVVTQTLTATVPAFAPRPRSRFQPYYAVLIMVPILIAVIVGSSLLVKSLTESGRADRVIVPSDAEQSTLANIGPAPYVSALPPIVEESRNPKVVESSEIVGPRKARIVWTNRVQMPEAMDMLYVAAIGPEGNVYLAGSGVNNTLLCTMKDRKFLWGYSPVPIPNRRRLGGFDIAPDGRIWLNVEYDDRLCFNSRGDGGHMPAALKPWIRERPSTFKDTLNSNFTGSGYACLPGHDHRSFPPQDRPGVVGRAWTGGSGWFLALDQPCSRDAPLAIGRNGDAYVQTISRRIYRISMQGQVRFSYTAPCLVKEHYPLASGDLLFACEHDLYRIHDGNLQWKFSWRSEYTKGLLIDKAETIYAIEYFGNRAFDHQSHVVAISASGEKLWEFALKDLQAEDLFLDASGTMYLTASGGWNTGRWAVLCLKD